MTELLDDMTKLLHPLTKNEMYDFSSHQ